MQQHDRQPNIQQIASHRKLRRSRAIDAEPYHGPAHYREISLHDANWSSPDGAEASVEFGCFRCFRVLLRQRQLLADGVPVELGSRAFDLLLALVEADSGLVTKEELMSRVWPRIVVSEENLKVQICALRKALGADRDIIRTEFGRGYRFAGVLRSNASVEAGQQPAGAKLRSDRALVQQHCWRTFRVRAPARPLRQPSRIRRRYAHALAMRRR
jgi:DNA-binding winged helix-turn-helix (wHTH) protein